MTKIKCVLLLLLSLFTLISSSKLLAAPNASVEGTVTNQVTGAPIQGALIVLIKGSQVRASTTTDSNGNYLITGVQPGNYTIVVNAPLFQSSAVGAKLSNNETTIVNVSLVPNGGIISGTVSDANTTSLISGATVELFSGTTLLSITSTDALGNYSFPNLAPGSYTVVARAAGYSDNIRDAIVTEGATTIVNFVLVANLGTIAGRVIDALTNTPVVGATATIILDDTTIIGSVDTDANGNYTFPGLAPGNYTVVVSAINYQTKIVGAIVTSGNITIVNFALASNPGTIQGIVTRADTGAPISDATVALFQQLDFIESILTGPDGTYSFSDLAPGNYIIVADAHNFQIEALDGTVTANAITTVNFSLNTNPGTIVGKVIDSVTANPIPDATIRVLIGPVVLATAVTDSNGNYAIPDLAPNTYSVVAHATGFQIAHTTALVSANITSLVNFSLNRNPGTISGKVIGATLKPIEGATVAVFQGISLIAFDLTDINGDYSISDLAPGNYTVEVHAAGFQIAHTSASVIANMTTVTNFVLGGNSGAISGKVIVANTLNPIKSAIVTVFQGKTLIAFALTDVNGNYSILDLVPGKYNVVVQAAGFQVGHASASVIANETTVVNFVLKEILKATSGAVTTIHNCTRVNKFLTQKVRVLCI